MASKHSRRQFLTKAGLGAAGVALAACQPKTVIVETERTVVVEKEVEKVVKETVIVEGTPQVVEKTVKEIVKEVVTATPEPATPPPVDTGPLTIMWVSQVALVENFQKYSEEVFSPANNGAEVEFIIVPHTEFPQKLLSGIAAGNPPDIFRTVSVYLFNQYANGGVLLALDDLIARDGYQGYLDTFLPGSLDAGQVGGKQFGIPFGAHPSSQFLFHNKTALAEKGITLDDFDWTWADYAEVANTMTDPDNQVFGTWIRCNLEGWVVGVRSMGGDIMDSTGTKSLLDDEPAQRWFEFVFKLLHEDQVVAPPLDVRDWKPPFAAGKIMMANDNGYRDSFLREMVEDFEFDTFQIPNEGDMPRGVLVCDFAGITSASNHVDRAWEWNKGILETEQGISRVENARFIPLPTPAALLPEGKELAPQYEFYVRRWIEDPPIPLTQPANGRAAEAYRQLLQKGFDSAWVIGDPAPIDEVRLSAHEQLQKDPGQGSGLAALASQFSPIDARKGLVWPCARPDQASKACRPRG
jgi:ABC-type glycerol-3-phosphate transport system substrate-binding protein